MPGTNTVLDEEGKGGGAGEKRERGVLGQGKRGIGMRMVVIGEENQTFSICFLS